MRPFPLAVSVRSILFGLFVDPLNAQDLVEPIEVRVWDSPNCTGRPSSTIIDSTNLAKNISTYYRPLSFELKRPLRDNEQLDLSVTFDLGDFLPRQGSNSSCADFLESYTADNGTTDCHNTPVFTCHRLWLNPGL
ncbi:hypothetical protein BDV59DRAFT_119734 [Aspergillus ambiguus]|uniref:uncharacterized protein n=1 Tax=Aspergillus ambiguus TaxID=176160 RepID=UPI003CCE00FE